MADLIEEVMKGKGPCLSTELTRILVSEYALSPAAARQRVSRAGTQLKRLAYLPFPRKARFLYLQRDYRSDQYWSALNEAILGSKSSYAPALAALIQRDGLMPKEHFQIACGAPLRQKKHLSPDTILSRLVLSNVIEEIEVPGVGACIALAEVSHHLDINGLKARLVTESILLKAIRMWARNLGLVSYEKVVTRDDDNGIPRVGTFAWDLTGPSYLAPMVEWRRDGKPSPGFLACDIFLGSEISTIGLQPFLHKCITLRNLKNVGRCLSFFVANSYSREAFGKAKEGGVIPATPETLFGKEVAEGLTQLTEVLVKAASMSTNPAVFDTLFKKLGAIEGAATNLRGALFEYVAADLARQVIPAAQVYLNQLFRDEYGKVVAEVDVLAVEGNRAVHFIECKGYQPSATIKDEVIEKWLDERIPFIRTQALNHPKWRNMTLHFAFWTSGKISAVAEARVLAAKSKTSKYEIEYRDGAGIAVLAREVNDTALMRTLNQHFLAHPLAKIERGVEAEAKRTAVAAGQPVVYPEGEEKGRKEMPPDGDPVAPAFDFLRPVIPFAEHNLQVAKPVVAPADKVK